MMPSLSAQLAAMTHRAPEKPIAIDRPPKYKPSPEMIELTYSFVHDDPITSGEIKKLIDKEKSTAQACLRFLCEEDGRIVRVKNGARGQRRYVRAKE